MTTTYRATPLPIRPNLRDGGANVPARDHPRPLGTERPAVFPRKHLVASRRGDRAVRRVRALHEMVLEERLGPFTFQVTVRSDQTLPLAVTGGRWPISTAAATDGSCGFEALIVRALAHPCAEADPVPHVSDVRAERRCVIAHEDVAAHALPPARLVVRGAERDLDLLTECMLGCLLGGPHVVCYDWHDLLALGGVDADGPDTDGTGGHARDHPAPGGDRRAFAFGVVVEGRALGDGPLGRHVGDAIRAMHGHGYGGGVLLHSLLAKPHDANTTLARMDECWDAALAHGAIEHANGRIVSATFHDRRDAMLVLGFAG